MSRNNIIPVDTGGKVSSYGGAAQTAEVRAETVREVVRIQSGLLFEKPTERIPLNDTAKVMEVSKKYIDLCAEKGLLPGFQGLAVLCGCSRMALYDYISRKPDSPTGIFLEKCRCAFLAARQSAADRGGTGEALTIFLLKNSYQNYADKLEITPTVAEPYSVASEDELKQKYISDMIPDTDGGIEE